MSSALKTNPYLERGVITGCLRVSKESSLSGLNNVESHTILTRGSASSLGLNLRKCKICYIILIYVDAYPQFEYHYEGYNFCGRHAHNPWSVIMCTRALLENAKYPHRTYWLNTSGNDIIADVIHQNNDIRRKYFDLLRGQTLQAAVSEYLTWKKLRADS